MAVTIQTGVPLAGGLTGAMGEPLQGKLFGADFRSQRYSLGSDAAGFADLFAYVRADVVNYFNPVTDRITACPANEPLFFDPRGRRGLNISSVQGALLAGLPTAAGSSSHTYASNRDNAACILEVFGAPGAWLRVSGDVAPTFPDASLEGGRFRHIYLTLRPSTTRGLLVEFNDRVRGWKLSLNPFEEFGGISFNGGSGAVPTLTVVPGLLARLEAAGRFSLRGMLRLMGHRGGVGTWGKSLSIEDADGNGLQFSMLNGVWTLISTQAVAAGGQDAKAWTMPVSRYLLAERRSEDLGFDLAWDKAARLASLTTQAGRALKGIPLPVMGPIASITVGRHGTNSPKMSLSYLAATRPA